MSSHLETRAAPLRLADRRRLLMALGAAPAGALAAPPGATGRAGELPGLASAAPVALANTRQLDIHVGGIARRLFIAVPDGPVPAQGHPVLWALDGNTMFPLLAALLRQRAARPEDVRLPVPVVVALGHVGAQAYDQEARARDFTLPEAGGGQADRFLDLLQHQLRPWLARELPVHPEEHTLFGHSFGGLLTLYALFTRPSLFRHHVAASPSIWWADFSLLAHRNAFLARRHDFGAEHRLLVTAGSLEEGQPQPNAERARRQQARRQIGASRELVASLAGVPGLQPEFRLLEGEDHGSLVLPSAALALEAAAPAPRKDAR